jgi:hypothetical protein
VTSITLSKAVFLRFGHQTLAEHYQIRSSNFRSAYPPEKWDWPSLQGAKWLNNGYYLLNLKNMRRWFQQSTKCVDGFIQVVKQTDKMCIVPFRAIVGPAHLGGENAESDRTDNIGLVNNQMDCDTYWTVY